MKARTLTPILPPWHLTLCFNFCVLVCYKGSSNEADTGIQIGVNGPRDPRVRAFNHWRFSLHDIEKLYLHLETQGVIVIIRY